MKQGRPIDSLILTIRGQRVILDADLAEIYGVTTKRLNEQVKRNADRFPEDFMFQLTPRDWVELRETLDDLNVNPVDNNDVASPRSQIATLNVQPIIPQYNGAFKPLFSTKSKPVGGNRKYFPFAFTEHGALMAANVLNSPEAVKMSVYVIRAFIQQRVLLMTQADILKKFAQIDSSLLNHDEALQVIWRELQPLLQPPPEPPRRGIGFHAKEKRPAYKIRRPKR